MKLFPILYIDLHLCIEYWSLSKNLMATRLANFIFVVGVIVLRSFPLIRMANSLLSCVCKRWIDKGFLFFLPTNRPIERYHRETRGSSIGAFGVSSGRESNNLLTRLTYLWIIVLYLRMPFVWLVLSISFHSAFLVRYQ